MANELASRRSFSTQVHVGSRFCALLLLLCASFAPSTAISSRGKLLASRKLQGPGGGPGGGGPGPGGGPPGGGGGGGGPGSGKVCGITKASRALTYGNKNGLRVVKTNGCPGYNWYLKGHTKFNATAAAMTLNFPLAPVISSTVTKIGTGRCVLGPVGVALNGVFLFSNCDALGRDALKFEGNSFDSCGGHPTPTGMYHYHVLPGITNGASVNGSRNLNYKLCSSAFMYDATSYHSPIIGFMADGIPVFGPRTAGGAVPSNLDACSGHASDLGYYHYHATTNAPYLPGCLRGCVTKSYGWTFGSSSCSKAATQYNYASLKTVKFV